jgi:hypothetical protein
MQESRRWSIRRIKCPDEKGVTELLIEWKVQKGKKILQSISCSHPELAYYSGKDCQWPCLKKISQGKGS